MRAVRTKSKRQKVGKFENRKVQKAESEKLNFLRKVWAKSKSQKIEKSKQNDFCFFCEQYVHYFRSKIMSRTVTS